MNRYCLTVNAGSSSLKYALYEIDSENCFRRGKYQYRDGCLDQTEISGDGSFQQESVGLAAGDCFLRAATADLFDRIADEDNLMVEVASHRIVHGGDRYFDPERVTDELLVELEKLESLAPLHQPSGVAGIRALQSRYSSLPQIACFDTAFHRTRPQLKQIYALPERVTQLGVRRYGFHGLAYESISRYLGEHFPELHSGRVVACQLGSGVSLCAMAGGISIDTTMGFSALEGPPMSTRSGSLDPGAVLYMVDSLEMTVQQVEDLLYRQSGLLGLSGESSDTRTLLASSGRRARLAIDYFVDRVADSVAQMAQSLGGLDAIVFSGGVGEHQPEIRERIVEKLEWLGVQIDPQRNEGSGALISPDRSRVRALVVAADEERMLARHGLDWLNTAQNR